MGLSTYRNGTFLHRLQQGRLCLGRRTVDLIRQHDIGENGAVVEFEMAIFIQNLRSCNIGRHKVRRKLDTLEIQVSTSEMVLTKRVFANPGTPTNKLCPLLNREMITAMTTSSCPTIIFPTSLLRSL